MTTDGRGPGHAARPPRKAQVRPAELPVDAWRWVRNRTLPLLAALVLLLAMHPLFVLEGGRVSTAFPVALTVVPLFGVAALGSWRRAIPLVVLFCVMIGWAGIAFDFQPEEIARSPIEILAFCYYLYATISIGATLVSSRSLLDDRVYGGLAVYLLAGCMFATLHRYLSATDSEAYWSALQDRGVILNWDSALYYSFVTLTTVGFGDVVPRTAPARAATILEAVAGVFITVVFIARVSAIALGQVPAKEQGPGSG